MSAQPPAPQTPNDPEKISHFKNLVMLAFIDGHLDQQEIDWIYEKGAQVGLSREAVQQVIMTPTNTAYTPPASRTVALHQLLDLVRLSMADGLVLDHERQYCQRVAVKLGVPPTIIAFLTENIPALDRGELTENDLVKQAEERLRG